MAKFYCDAEDEVTKHPLQTVSLNKLSEVRSNCNFRIMSNIVNFSHMFHKFCYRFYNARMINNRKYVIVITISSLSQCQRSSWDKSCQLTCTEGPLLRHLPNKWNNKIGPRRSCGRSSPHTRMLNDLLNREGSGERSEVFSSQVVGAGVWSF